MDDLSACDAQAGKRLFALALALQSRTSGIRGVVLIWFIDPSSVESYNDSMFCLPRRLPGHIWETFFISKSLGTPTPNAFGGPRARSYRRPVGNAYGVHRLWEGAAR